MSLKKIGQEEMEWNSENTSDANGVYLEDNIFPFTLIVCH